MRGNNREKQVPELHLRRINLTMLIFITVLGLSGLLSFFLLDERVLSWFCNHPQNRLQGSWLLVTKGFGRAWLPSWLLLNWISAGGRQRPALVGLLAIILIAPMVPTLKVLVRRPRPDEVIAASTKIEGAEGENSNDWWKHNLSFPSGDAAIVFAVATALAPFVKWPWVVSFFGIACIVSIKRVTSLAHYPSDVFAGAAIGIFSGWLALQIILRWLPGFKLWRVHAVAGAILIPVVYYIAEGYEDLLDWLKTYGVLVVIVYLIANAGTLSKLLRRHDAC